LLPLLPERQSKKMPTTWSAVPIPSLVGRFLEVTGVSTNVRQINVDNIVLHLVDDKSAYNPATQRGLPVDLNAHIPCRIVLATG
jgi:hypothetical protein